ncbi:TIM-barrel domain-containing protein [Nocardioides sambongensis]|uniref:TIM-barrel domain-containing protein n=1 Tax=Nocardioides sambongensis TaxID=2589074 RepID=UPI0011263D2A|nr:TIM-barrel domain-containing protein [Nocardioides sambongensis]
MHQLPAGVRRGVEAGAFSRNPDGSPLTYPYSTARHFTISQVDFSGEAGREYFKDLLQESVDHGYDGWMEDFGEYSPDSAVSDDGTPGPTMHNRYVEQYHATAREFEEEAPRPLLRFNRSGWTDAIKESSIVWGGDPRPPGASTD